PVYHPLLCFAGAGDPRGRHSFPTRRSSDLRRKNSTPVGSKKAGQGGKILTQHSGLPPRSHDGNAWDKREQAKAAAEARRKAEKRSEEHTSELQSRENLVCRLLLEKKKSDRG